MKTICDIDDCSICNKNIILVPHYYVGKTGVLYVGYYSMPKNNMKDHNDVDAFISTDNIDDTKYNIVVVVLILIVLLLAYSAFGINW
jgi:hypothetical protein